MRDFDSLSQKEILALAISLEEEDERIYADFGESLRENFPGTAQVFEEMRQEEIGHRRQLIELYRQKFGEHIPLIRRQDVRGFVQRKPIWLNTSATPGADPRAGRDHGSGDVPLLCARRGSHSGRQHPSVAGRSRRRGDQPRRACRRVGEARNWGPPFARKKTKRVEDFSFCRSCSPDSQA